MPQPAPLDQLGDDCGLRYVEDTQPGYSRVRVNGKTFHYLDTRGKRIQDPRTIARINALAIPPAYEDVWICPAASGHIQATGRDARGRKQYRYHPTWTEVRGANKYDQLLAFGNALPALRRQVSRDLRAPGLTQDKVLAAVVSLLELTLIRVGSKRYAVDNKSYGLTTLTRRHTEVLGSQIRLRFRGKSGISHDVKVKDARIARLVKRCLELPGQQLFHFLDDEGEPHAVDSGMVNAYLKRVMGEDFTAKHCRTWAGSVMACAALQRTPWEDARQAGKRIVEVVKQVSARLGNTPTVCRACYIHPGLLDAYEAGNLPAFTPAPGSPRALSADERRLLAVLAKI
ncbi:DNA topoisomerase IB (poxvirus type) [plant metagenome]|uniref:DNA topoisomerase IB (Poxvirus type) n=1 Tax=plant metagenome TaxID=1297885 RepID=A0A484Q608_9ZZZZ